MNNAGGAMYVKPPEKLKPEEWNNAIAPNGQHIVSLSKDHTLRVWDIQTGECAFVSTLSSPPRCCDISRDSGTLVVGDELGRLHVYLLQTI